MFYICTITFTDVFYPSLASVVSISSLILNISLAKRSKNQDNKKEIIQYIDSKTKGIENMVDKEYVDSKIKNIEKMVVVEIKHLKELYKQEFKFMADKQEEIMAQMDNINQNIINLKLNHE